MCACPGGPYFGTRAGEPVLAKRLEHDLELIASWGAAGLVSLLEPDELAWLGIEHLPEAAGQAGLWWRHLPIPDMSVPGQVFEEQWREIGPQLHAELADGGRFAIHCLAGLGRTGTVVARLLVEAGAEPAQAIRRVRAARTGTIQTRQQELYVEHRAWQRCDADRPRR